MITQLLNRSVTVPGPERDVTEIINPSTVIDSYNN